MNPFREMVLLSLEEYQKLRQRALIPTEGLQRDLQELKQEYGTFLPADQRAKLESEIISKHSIGDKLEPSSSPALPTKVDDTLIIEHFNSFPKSNKTRALQMFHHLKSYKSQWNTMGQFLDSDNNPIANSNIVELINYVTSPSRAKNNPPAGFIEFINLLVDANTPRNFLSAIGLQRIENNKHVVDDSINDMDKSGWFST